MVCGRGLIDGYSTDETNLLSYALLSIKPIENSKWSRVKKMKGLLRLILIEWVTFKEILSVIWNLAPQKLVHWLNTSCYVLLSLYLNECKGNLKNWSCVLSHSLLLWEINNTSFLYIIYLTDLFLKFSINETWFISIGATLPWFKIN